MSLTPENEAVKPLSDFQLDGDNVRVDLQARLASTEGLRPSFGLVGGIPMLMLPLPACADNLKSNEMWYDATTNSIKIVE